MLTYIAFLRGINVSGHHKVPMAELKLALEAIGCSNVITILNSGNVIFDSEDNSKEELEQLISTHLEQIFGFKIPTFLKTKSEILSIIASQPFKSIDFHKNTRAYITFLKQPDSNGIKLPWQSEDGSYKILEITNHSLISVLDISVSKTTKSMQIVERTFGKNVTTRNWKTILRIEKKLNR